MQVFSQVCAPFLLNSFKVSFKKGCVENKSYGKLICTFGELK